jgi:hypothetical protein
MLLNEVQQQRDVLQQQRAQLQDPQQQMARLTQINASMQAAISKLQGSIGNTSARRLLGPLPLRILPIDLMSRYGAQWVAPNPS